MIDNLGDRMKSYYEDRTKTFLPRRTYTIMRIDGCHFRTYMLNSVKPFDYFFINHMDETAKYLCQSIQGAKFAYVQSDEISIVLTDFDTLKTDAWFNGTVQKITSVGASLATAKFNQLRANYDDIYKEKLATFDCRVFTIPDIEEVANYILWRQSDATRNSISTAAQFVFSHKDLEGAYSAQKLEMLLQHGINWHDYPNGIKHGRAIIRKEIQMISDGKSIPEPYNGGEIPENFKLINRLMWQIDREMPLISENRDYILNQIKPKEI
jgi:tRNA(His) 5'-end guanylyltransferase